MPIVIKLVSNIIDHSDNMNNLLLFICFGLASTQNWEDQPKLPMFVGRAYDLLKGNPLNNQIDPGFLNPIFAFTYNNRQTTSDGRYFVPDGVSHHKVSSCAFSTDVSTYRGTESYQQELSTKASIEGGYKGSVVEASFSFSTSFERMQKSTIESNQSITHATAQCEAYQLSIDLFTTNDLLPNFIAGVKESYRSGNWTKFIAQFGTHFIYDVIMGGRAVQQITYDFESISKLNSLGIDISVAAKASFAKFYGDSSYQWKKNTAQIEYSETLSKQILQLYIGGEANRNGNINEWAQKVIDNPMPIKYRMYDIAELFEKINDDQFDVKQATDQYYRSLDEYCQRLGCRAPTPDKPKPPPATVAEFRTPNYGGNGGRPFPEFKVESTTLNAVQFILKHGSGIDNLQILLSDGVKNVYTPSIGGTGGDRAVWDVPKGQWVQQIEYRSSDEVYSLTFITNAGVKSPHFGGNGGLYFLVTFPEGYRILGFYGRQGSRIDQLGFILGKTIYPPYGKPYLQTIRTSVPFGQEKYHQKFIQTIQNRRINEDAEVLKQLIAKQANPQFG